MVARGSRLCVAALPHREDRQGETAMTGVSAHDARPRQEVDLLVGTTINGKFEIHAVLANGGMGRIYRGEQVPLGRAVAVKVLHSRYTSSQEDPAFQKRFFLEASILSKLQHPNIVTVFDYGRIEGLEDESYFMAMEFLVGETLHRRLRALGAMPPPEAIGLVRQIAKGLREAHRQGVVHRDLKPSNIMMVPENDGTELVKILDFGLVKVLADDSEELTKEGTFLGSPRYMSPEQIAHGKVDHRTDVYSLGVILYHCLCGRTPFENENSVHTLMAHLQLPVPPMRERNPAVDVPPPLEAFVRRCLEKDPNARPAAMEDFLRGLRECEVALGLAPATALGAPSSGFFVSGAGASAVDPTLAQSWSRPDAPPASSTPPQTAPSVAPTVPAVPAAPAVSATVAPAASASAPGQARNAVAIGAAAVLVATLALLAVRSVGTAPPSPAPPVPAATPPPSPLTPPNDLREYRLVIDSSVEGAQVYEGAALLGATPLTLVVDNRAVALRPRQLEVRKAGYEPFVVRAVASDEPSLRVIANLVASREAPPPEVPRPLPTRPPPRAPRPAPRPPAPPEDIRSHR
jgi:serine/threonine protein kinase